MTPLLGYLLLAVGVVAAFGSGYWWRKGREARHQTDRQIAHRVIRILARGNHG